MTVPKRRTLWRMKGDAPLADAAPDLLLRNLCVTGNDSSAEEPETNSLSSIALKLSLAAAVGVFATISPAAPALGNETANIRVVKAEAPDILEEGIVLGGDDDPTIEVAKPDSGKADIPDEAKESESDDPEEPGSEEPDLQLDALSDDTAGFEALALDEQGEEIALMAGGTISVNSQASFESAITSLGGVGTIQLSSSFTVANPIEIPSNANLTIKLNGKTLTGTGSSVINMAGGSSLTVSGPGTVHNSGQGNALSASGRIGSLLLDGSASFFSTGKVFSNISLFTGTRIAAGCSFSDAEGLFSFKDNYRDGQEITFSNGHFVLAYWPDPDKESWYAKFLFVYCPTEADYELYTKRVGPDYAEFPEETHTVAFRNSNGATIKQDTVLKGHCIGDKMGGTESAPPTNEQMQSLAPEGTTFEGWVDPKGKLLSVDEICAIPVMSDVVYTARFKEKPTDPVVPPGPIGPVEPVKPDPIGPDQPVNPTPGPDFSYIEERPGGEATLLPANPSRRTLPQAPATPWNPPGLALAAGFTVPESGPGVVILDEFGEPLTAGAGAGDGDAPEDGISLFDAREGKDSGLPFSSADVAMAAALMGGAALTALITSRVSSFMAANANTPRKRRRKALGLE